MSFDVKRIVLIAVAVLLAVVLGVLVIVALTGLGNGGGATPPTTAPTQPTEPREDRVIETPYGNILFPGQYAPYLQVERTDSPELTLHFIAKMDSGKTQNLFDLRFGAPIEPAIGQIVSDEGVVVGVYLTAHSFSPDGTWSVMESTQVSEMLELVNDLVGQLELQPLGVPVPDIEGDYMVIDTPYCKLYFPERWKEELRITVDQSKGYEMVFSGAIGEHEPIELFTLNFGGGKDTGGLFHTLQTENGVPLHVYLRTVERLEVEGWSEVDIQTAKTMQEDVNEIRWEPEE